MSTVINVDWRKCRTLLSVPQVQTSTWRQKKAANSTNDQRDYEWNAAGIPEFTRSNSKNRPLAWQAKSMHLWTDECLRAFLHNLQSNAHDGAQKDLLNCSTAAKRTKPQKQGQLRYNTCIKVRWKTTVPPPMLKRNWSQPTVHTTDGIQEST